VPISTSTPVPPDRLTAIERHHLVETDFPSPACLNSSYTIASLMADARWECLVLQNGDALARRQTTMGIRRPRRDAAEISWTRFSNFHEARTQPAAFCALAACGEQQEGGTRYASSVPSGERHASDTEVCTEPSRLSPGRRTTHERPGYDVPVRLLARAASARRRRLRPELRGKFREARPEMLRPRVDGVVGYAIVDLTRASASAILRRDIPNGVGHQAGDRVRAVQQAGEGKVRLDEMVTLDRRQRSRTGVLVEMGTPTLSTRD